MASETYKSDEDATGNVGATGGITGGNRGPTGTGNAGKTASGGRSGGGGGIGRGLLQVGGGAFKLPPAAPQG